jgi:Cu/Zn superoxide dismutase
MRLRDKKKPPWELGRESRSLWWECAWQGEMGGDITGTRGSAFAFLSNARLIYPSTIGTSLIIHAPMKSLSLQPSSVGMRGGRCA